MPGGGARGARAAGLGPAFVTVLDEAHAEDAFALLGHDAGAEPATAGTPNARARERGRKDGGRLAGHCAVTSLSTIIKGGSLRSPPAHGCGGSLALASSPAPPPPARPRHGRRRTDHSANAPARALLTRVLTASQRRPASLSLTAARASQGHSSWQAAMNCRGPYCDARARGFRAGAVLSSRDVSPRHQPRAPSFQPSLHRPSRTDLSGLEHVAPSIAISDPTPRRRAAPTGLARLPRDCSNRLHAIVAAQRSPLVLCASSESVARSRGNVHYRWVSPEP